MTDHDNGQVSTLQRPTTDDPKAWKAYWKAQGWPWRTEPEIDTERQKYLAERRAIVPDIEKGIYPFRDIEPKLTRADIEWLLATHENGRGPVDWSDVKQRKREGLDMRGTYLYQVDLSDLPLARLQAGFPPIEIEWSGMTEGQRTKAAKLLAEANFAGANLNEVNFTGSHLEGAYLCDAHMEGAYLCVAHLEEAHLAWTHLGLADFTWAYLIGTNMVGAHMEEASLNNVVLGDKQGVGPRLLDVHWEQAHLTVVDWSQVKKLGEEHQARQKKDSKGITKDKQTRLNEYREATRANQQLANALQGQGLGEEADYFAYRVQKLQRIVLRRQRKFGRYFFSIFLDLLAGYGYRPGRSVIWYLATIFVFAFAYHFLGELSLYPPDSFVFSVMSFHGRGFFPALSNETNLHNPLVMLAAFEAVVGLLIEISFIATFTQRFLGR